jgi:hypothetical protein
MIAPGKWADEGPGRAVGGAEGVRRELGGRGIGHMVPELTGGIMLQNRSVSPERAERVAAVSKRRWNGAPRT